MKICIRDVQVCFGGKEIIGGVDLDIARGESVAVIGESGAGKTTLALSLMGLSEGEKAGAIVVEGLPFGEAETDLLRLSEEKWRELRGRHFAMVFQNTANGLNPVIPVLDQVAEAVFVHGLASPEGARKEARQALVKTGFPSRRQNAYPHQLSGGQRQQVMLAMALVNNPDFLILDEPTASLDPITRSEILDCLKGLQRERAMLVITHDLATASALCQRVAVMYRGRIVEEGALSDVFSRPGHPYSRALLRAYPNMTTTKDIQGIRDEWEAMLLSSPAEGYAEATQGASRPRLLRGCAFRPRCTQAVDRCATESPALQGREGRKIACHRGGVIPLIRVEGLSKSFGSVTAVAGLSFSLAEGETLAIVGQSGSGKSTIARLIMGLEKAEAGQLFFEEAPVSARGKDFYRKAQLIFQHPQDAVSHRMTVREALLEPLVIQGLGSREEREERIKKALVEVGFFPSEALLSAYVHYLSGGEAQRLVIARALILNPKLLIADEPTSALDTLAQARILKLLMHLQEQRGLAMIFITHDLALARKVSDRILVLQEGQVVEEGLSWQVTGMPQMPYTQRLIAAAPRLL
ncbi:ABC transporter ATP-binding protein [Heliomicrobium modesticaldum]|uniref:ABC transporter ATP-binding protein n=1 Tax=Heliomicrobium modesticaldum TaxID=35701 RepID=UPI001F3BF85E|nr:ABC transporter ATP-binding protein [Heliomicrobium modesticaldum]